MRQGAVGARLDERDGRDGASAGEMRRTDASGRDGEIAQRYRQAGGRDIPLRVPPASASAFRHGDGTEGDPLTAGGWITGVVERDKARTARAFSAVYAAGLWPWCTEAGPPAHLEELSVELEDGPGTASTMRGARPDPIRRRAFRAAPRARRPALASGRCRRPRGC